ncbi:MFS transporter [Actinospica durhamensis]|uniref:MFS transporter n=1 Tax=Actinospica durhamensis TaxID=1508375 RepID=A0A941IQV0_9ACTN|nr:MFS transporter [Actinospica durhamensis]MBR7836669.1 MFS transporter [Actinospica durhamensis]
MTTLLDTSSDLPVVPAATLPAEAAPYPVEGAIDVVDAVESAGHESIFNPRYLAITIGFISSVLLTAFEAMAVGAAMPVAVAQLHGMPFYSLAFSGYLTTSLFGMVLAGQRSDRRGPRLPFLGGIVAFGIGLVTAGTATTMAQLVAGRAIQGFGGGMTIVALYVLVGRTFAEHLRGKAFSAMAACWVLPAAVGPVVAGVLTEDLSWRWIFLGVAVLIVIPLFLLAKPLRDLPRPEQAERSPEETVRLRRIRIAAGLTALGAGVLELGSQEINLIGLVLAPVALVLLVPSVPKLLPPGTLRARRGLPTVILMRGLMAGYYFGIEAFIPLMLEQHRGMSVTVAGLSLATATVGWAASSWAINKPFLTRRLSRPAMVRLGITICAVSLLGNVLAVDTSTPLWTVAAAMLFASLGSGMAFPVIALLTLEYSEPHEQGANSASLQVADGITSTTTIALAGGVYHALGKGSTASGGVFVLIFALFISIALLAWGLAPRVRK